MAKLLKTIDGSKYAMYDAYSNWHFHQHPVIQVYKTKKSSKFYNPVIADAFRRDLGPKAMLESYIAMVVVAGMGLGLPVYLTMFGTMSTGLLQLALFSLAALLFLAYPIFVMYSHIVLKSTDQATVNLEKLGFSSETSKADFVDYFNKNVDKAEEIINLALEENELCNIIDNADAKTKKVKSEVGSRSTERLGFIVKDVEKKSAMLEQILKGTRSRIKALARPAVEVSDAKVFQGKEEELLSVVSSM